MRTPVCEKLGIEIPIVQAPFGFAVGPRLASAVCRAGGLGTIPLWRADVETVRQRIREMKSLTNKPFAVNLNLAFPQEERLDACLEEGVPIISFFWGDPAKLVSRAKAGGAMVMQTVSSADEAGAAVRNGVDIIVAQGWEAGGHVWGSVATMALVPAVVDAVSPVPVIAAGGISDGRGLAAALALGASGAWIGTRFLASTELDIHERYRERLLKACETDTVYLQNLFDVGWPNAPHRALRNRIVTEWEAAGRPESGNRPGEGDIVAISESRGQIPRYSALAALGDAKGDIDALVMYAGQGVSLVRKLQPAGEIVGEIYAEARAILGRLGAMSA
jgi:NAD(P)H-dependent flavin oxidoreductase YrpB (nitropropane dioxygenase family)